MSQQDHKGVSRKCSICGEVFRVYIMSKHSDLCKHCRKALKRSSLRQRDPKTDYALQRKLVSEAACRRRDAFLAERDAKAPPVAVKFATCRDRLGKTIVYECRGHIPVGTGCTFNRY